MRSSAILAVASRKSQTLGFIVSVLVLALCSGCRGGSDTVLTELDEARRLTADLRVQFANAADASNRAVMAETDEASIAFAHDAEQTKRSVAADTAALTPQLSRLGFPNEIRFASEFGKQFSAYEALDHDILALAVENTNLKAQHLSFGPAREAADSFRDALQAIQHAGAAKDQCRVDALIGSAVLAVREIQVLQAPHIAEPDDASMTHIEKDMTALDAAARAALIELSGLLEPKASLAAARAALDRFKGVGDQLISLSRRNSNVRSLDLSLRAKPPLTAACDVSLRALQDALAKEGATATR